MLYRVGRNKSKQMTSANQSNLSFGHVHARKKLYTAQINQKSHSVPEHNETENNVFSRRRWNSQTQAGVLH